MAGRGRGRIQKIGEFTCEACALSTPYHSFGRKHPFTSSFVLLEEAYVARDPFSPTPQPLVLGSHCASCNKVVCVASTCSIFYSKRFCLECVRAHPDEFPAQILQVLTYGSDQAKSVTGSMSSVAATGSHFSGGAVSWKATTLSVLAGMGLGYLIGLFTFKLFFRRGGGGPHRPQRVGTGEGESAARTASELVAALSSLTAEVSTLQTTLADVLRQIGRSSRRRHTPRGVGAESIASEYASAQVGSSDDEFFDMEAEEEEEGEGAGQGDAHTFQSLDKLGQSTLEKEEACHTLIGELTRQLDSTPDSMELLWRLSRALVHLSMHCQQAGRAEQEKELLQKAAGHAQRGVELDPGAWQCHQWYAIALGSQVKYESTQRKITGGHEYKEHIDTAISLNPNEPNLFYLRGRWSFEVAGLSWLEKKAASALYATPPDATYDQALSDFMTCENLKGGVWKANLMMIAKCHIKLGDVPTAMDWLNRARQLDVVTTEDRTAHKEIDELIATYDTPT